MANDFSNNPMILDTAGGADLIGLNASIRIRKIRWTAASGGVAADSAVLTNSAGKVLWEQFNSTAAAQFGYETDFYEPLRALGLKIPTLARGKVYVYTA
jgi:hypothetical protein